MTTTPEQAVIQAAFWKRVDRRGDDECWPWTATCNDRGYGMLSTKRASHLSLEIAGHPRPPGALALHSCDNPPCCNPNHLRWGTNADNVADMVERRRHHANRRSSCVHGHPLSGDNLIVRSNGQRHCRHCQRASHQAYKRRLKEKRHAQG